MMAALRVNSYEDVGYRFETKILTSCRFSEHFEIDGWIEDSMERRVNNRITRNNLYLGKQRIFQARWQ